MYFEVPEKIRKFQISIRNLKTFKEIALSVWARHMKLGTKILCLVLTQYVFQYP